VPGATAVHVLGAVAEYLPHAGVVRIGSLRIDTSSVDPKLMAGLTVGVMLIPQGMAYAMLAGLPPVYGLYASTVPLIIYAFFGTSRHLSVGPVAIDSMMVAAGVGAMALAGSPEYISLAITLALLVGFIQFTFGAFRLGFLINFLSRPVILGFTSAAAIIIGLSQFELMLGINVQDEQLLHEIIQSLVAGLAHIHLLTLIIGVGGIITLLLLKRFMPFFPGPLFLVIVTTLLVSAFDLHLLGVDIIGFVPAGLPGAVIPHINFEIIKKLLPTAGAIALISFMESIAVARALQAKHKTYKVISNKELIAIGMANMAGSVFKSFPVSGGFSRSAVNEMAGARTGMASIISAVLIVATLLFLTPLFYFLPKAILASIILVAVSRLIHLKETKYLWIVERKDFLMMMITFAGTLFLGIGTGIGIGVGLSLAWIIFEASYPHHAELGRIPGTHTFRNIKRFKDLNVDDDVLIFRFDAPLFFANVNRFRELLIEYQHLRSTKLKAVIIDMESINTIDTTAIHVFADTVEEIRSQGILFLIAEAKGPVRDRMHLSGFTQKLGEEHFFVTIEEALDFVAGTRKESGLNVALQVNK